jgi:hypothetical protein
MKTVGTTELAKQLGISRQRINELRRAGKIRREANGKWNPDKVRSQLSRTLDGQQEIRSRLETAPAAAEGGDVRGNAHEAFNRARAVKEIAIAKEKELNLRRRQEELLEAADVERAWTEAYIAFANRMRLIPDKLAPRVAALTDVLEIRLLIEKEIETALEALSETEDAA